METKRPIEARWAGGSPGVWGVWCETYKPIEFARDGCIQQVHAQQQMQLQIVAAVWFLLPAAAVTKNSSCVFQAAPKRFYKRRHYMQFAGAVKLRFGW
jgi:hypothetical protein